MSKVSVICDLTNKRLKRIDGSYLDIYALSMLRVTPEGIGVGRGALEIVARMAKYQGRFAVVGFADEFVVEFYRKCGWWVGDKYMCPKDSVSKYVVSSKPLPSGTIVSAGDMW